MLLGLIGIVVVYVLSCVCLIGIAELSALNKYEKPILRDVVMDMLSQPFYILWFLPWWLVFVVYRTIQMKREHHLPQAEPVTQEDILPRAHPMTQEWKWQGP